MMMNNRADHCIVSVNYKIINWGGMRADMLRVHSNQPKDTLTAAIEVLDVLLSLSWSCISTTGVP